MLLEPVRRHESSCVLIWRMGPDTPQLRVTQTQPSRPGYYFVNVNNRSTSVSLHVIASLLGQELLGSSLPAVHAARQVALRTLRTTARQRAETTRTADVARRMSARQCTGVKLQPAPNLPPPAAPILGHSIQSSRGEVAWHGACVSRCVLARMLRSMHIFPLRELRVVVRPGRGEAEAAKIARDPRELSFLAPWRRVVLPISMPAVARALLLRGPSRPVSPRALVGSWLPSSPAAAAASAPDPRPNPGVTSPRHRRAGGYGCLDW